ncbi:hydrolase [Bacillus manliponensis]|uniref:Hydrolase n=1 Tax=Bacillus manliponensis TaxID=574376 RepID=A0A073KCN2_9BACI|nr:zinc dependent phospholipase C family protein [Bacillus manliponensis]KEK20048.1 hydrolase [Bacillus manliponensis]
MGSRIMHFIIANKIADTLKIEDKVSFLLGGIAADAVNSGEDKITSHFYSGNYNDYSKSIDFERFLNKYERHQNSPFILGYYTHLIADDLWLKGFYLPWLKNRIEADSTVLNAYHNDFKLLNGKLLYHYDSKKNLLSLLDREANFVDIEEVTIENICTFKQFVRDDMLYSEKDLQTPLQVFTLQQIIGYIETSVHKGILYIKNVPALR